MRFGIFFSALQKMGLSVYIIALFIILTISAVPASAQFKPIYPRVTCPASVIQNLPANTCSQEVNLPYPVLTSNGSEIITLLWWMTGATTAESPLYGINYVPAPFLFQSGLTTIFYRAINEQGYSDTCSFTVNLKDITPPVITCPPNKNFEINANCSTILTPAQIGMATATDYCSMPVTISHNIPANYEFPVGNTFITWTAKDAAGNTKTCVQVITVARGICLVNYSYSNYNPPYPINVTGQLLPANTATGITSSQHFSSGLLTANRVQIVNKGVAPGPAAFYQHTDVIPGIYTLLKKTSSMQYYQFNISGLGTSYESFYFYFQFWRENNSDPKNIYVEWSTDNVNFTRSLTVDLKDYKPKVWHEIYQSLTGITQLNNSPQVFIRIYYDYSGNPVVYFDNFQYSAFNEDITTGSAVATNVACAGDSTGTIEIFNNTPGNWEYTINGGITWQTGKVFNDLPMGSYDVRMRDPGMLTCDVVIDVALIVASNDQTPPVISCPENVQTIPDNPAGTTATLTLPDPVITDNCPGIKSIYWSATGATALADSGFVSTQTFNTGITEVTYTATDLSSYTATCTFTVNVIGLPEIQCPADITNLTTDPGVCYHIATPGQPEILHGSNITFRWIMAGANCDTGYTAPIQNYPFNAGSTTITWIAQNGAGADTCVQQIIVTDNEPPQFTAPEPFVLCVEPIVLAEFYQPTTDITPERPEYYTFKAGDVLFDLDTANFHDNCTPAEMLILTWTIQFYDGTEFNGTGQPSTFGSDILIPGDGINFNDVTHVIKYRLTDASNNQTNFKNSPITIKPRPNVIKQP